MFQKACYIFYMSYSIRFTNQADLPKLEAIFSQARSFMRESGNLSQWPEGTPKIEEVKRDIAQGVSYVVTDGDSLIATFSAIPGIDPTYLDIEGEWLNDEEYVTIHKLAKGKGGTHIFEFVVDFCFRIADNIRIDTHEDNAPMRHLLKKNGFSYCGIIHLKNGEPRLAFQKIRKKDD